MHAYVILAHKNLEQLPRLVRTLDTGQASFFLHIDKKTDISPYKQALGKMDQLPNVQFVKRYHCPWAAFGIIKAQRAAMETALQTNPRLTHLTLLTGQDYPIKPPHEIDLFFDTHPGTSFIRHNPGKTKAQRRKLERHRYKSWHLYFAGRHRRVSANLLKKVGIRRRVPDGLSPVKGWAFFTLSRECTEYALRFFEENPRYVKFFKHTKHPDEYFWHTILLNSPLKNKISNTKLQYARYIPPTGRGATFGKENLDEMKTASSDYFFAKKFDTTVDSDILNLIDRHILRVTSP